MDAPPSRYAYALTATIQRLPEQPRRSLTWDQGKEMAEHARFTIDSGADVYFCEPSSPWQRGSNENTNGLLRQYLPKGTDLTIYDQRALDEIARFLAQPECPGACLDGVVGGDFGWQSIVGGKGELRPTKSRRRPPRVEVSTRTSHQRADGDRPCLSDSSTRSLYFPGCRSRNLSPATANTSRPS